MGKTGRFGNFLCFVSWLDLVLEGHCLQVPCSPGLGTHGKPRICHVHAFPASIQEHSPPKCLFFKANPKLPNRPNSALLQRGASEFSEVSRVTFRILYLVRSQYRPNNSIYFSAKMLSMASSFAIIRGQKFNASFFFPKFSGTPGISRQKSRDIPPKSLVSLGFEGHTELFGPHPFAWKTPHPTRRYLDQKVWVCGRAPKYRTKGVCAFVERS